MDNNYLPPRTREYPKPEAVECPYRTEYTCDVLVIGCGFAGLNAAYTAREAGCNVLVMDKGKPGYSGLSPWPSSFRWFDPERDDADAFRKAIREGGDYISNMRWYELWIRESKTIRDRLMDWGILAQYPKASEAGHFFADEDFQGYRETFDRFDRHKKWVKVLNDNGIPFLQHTMAAEMLTENGKVTGAVGFHVPSCTVITVAAKAVILATGAGSYRPAGYPTGSDTFDGEYMAYELGLPIAGKEFEDFHKTPASAPGNVFFDNHWQYLENIWLCGGDVTAQNATDYAASKGKAMAMTKVWGAVNGMPAADGSEIQDVAEAQYTRRGASACYDTDPEEIRSGKMSTPTAASALGGAAVGMSCHLTAGVFCGMENTDCSTAVPGLFVAGDGIHATAPSGAAYPCGVGFTSCFTSIDGSHAGTSAAAYAKCCPMPEAKPEALEAVKQQILAPLSVEKGFDANWARDVLQSIMAPYWVSTAKTEETLNAALTQVLYLQEHVIPRLAARCGHDLRLCMEMRHKAKSAEMKLRASLARRESRGTHYRSDIPYRDDENFLCYITVRKAEDGSMITERVPVPAEWAGDTAVPYDKRYHYYFPGEAKAKGFTEPAGKWGKGGRGK